MNTGLKPVWAGRNMRLDPFRLPQMVSYATRDDLGDVTFTIDHRGAVIRRLLALSGLPATIARASPWSIRYASTPGAAALLPITVGVPRENTGFERRSAIARCR